MSPNTLNSERTTPNRNTNIDNNSNQSTIEVSNWIGDTFSEDKQPQTLRIAFQNLNGLGSQHYTQNLALLANEQADLAIDILGMTEHCINIHHQDTLKNIHQTIRQTITEKSTIQIDASKSPTTQRYLPGGTATLLLGPIVGRIEPNGRGGDSMGRWSYIHLRRKHMKPITIITVYQVNQTPTNTIGNTAWHQQRIALDAQGHHDTHPRTAFINDLIAFITHLQDQQHDIIVGGDFNDTVYRRQSGLLKLIMHTNLYIYNKVLF